MFKSPHDTLDVQHSKIAYWRVGSGPDLLLVHGWPLHSGTYRNLLPILSEHFTCHLIDLPGAGLTEVRDREAVDLRRHVKTVLAVIDALGLKRYAMLAHDSGGMVTRSVAAARPEQVTALVLGNTEMPGYVSSMFKLFAAVGATSTGQWLMTAALGSARLRRSRLLYGSCFDDASLVDGEFGDMFVTPMQTPSARVALQFELLRDFDWSFTEELTEVHAKIACPVQLIWGKSDPWFPLKSAKAMLPKFPGGSELEVLDGKLFVHEEHPEHFATLAAKFIERSSADETRASRAA